MKKIGNGGKQDQLGALQSAQASILICLSTFFLLFGFANPAQAACRFGQVDITFADLAYEVVANSEGVLVDDLKSVAGTIEATPVDLDRDGTPELCIEATTTMTCSQGVAVCLFVIWSLEEERALAIVGGHSIGWDGFDGPGFASLRNEWASSDGCIYASRMVWSEDRYEPLPPRVIGQWAEPSDAVGCGD